MDKEQDPRIVALRLLKETSKSSSDLNTLKDCISDLIDSQITLIDTINIYKDMVKKYIEHPIETYLNDKNQ